MKKIIKSVFLFFCGLIVGFVFFVIIGMAIKDMGYWGFWNPGVIKFKKNIEAYEKCIETIHKLNSNGFMDQIELPYDMKKLSRDGKAYCFPCTQDNASDYVIAFDCGRKRNRQVFLIYSMDMTLESVSEYFPDAAVIGRVGGWNSPWCLVYVGNGKGLTEYL